MYLINATFVTSRNTTKVRALDVIVPPPIPRLLSIEFQLLVYILIFLRGRNDYE
jgi:hypothetical protein